MIKAICFDLDGVYFTETGKKGFHKALIEMTHDEDKVVHILYKSSEMLEFVTGQMNESDFWNFARKYLNLNLSDQDFRDLWIKEYEIDEKVRDSVLLARKKGYTTCICSNNNPARVQALQGKFNFLDDFDVKIFSYEVGAVKPSKEIFEALINKSGVKPSKIVYSDDNPERLQGANGLGINTFVYIDFAQFLEELEKFGVELQ